jgi:hypothetical protein
MIESSLIKTGDIIGFSGRNLHSDVINITTGGVPRWGISHVGIIGNSQGKHFLFESVENMQRCAILGEEFRGVQARRMSDVLANYDGRVWHYPIYRRLYKHEIDRLSFFLLGSLGKLYDTGGAIRSGGLLYGLYNAAVYGESLSELFCSELCSAAESRIGIFPTTNASRWNPNKLIRAMRRAGVLKRRRRLE